MLDRLSRILKEVERLLKNEYVLPDEATKIAMAAIRSNFMIAEGVRAMVSGRSDISISQNVIRLTRSMIETYITTLYLLQKPSERAQRIIDFGKVERKKQLDELLERNHEPRLSDALIQRVNDEYEEVKEQFLTRKGRRYDRWTEDNIGVLGMLWELKGHPLDDKTFEQYKNFYSDGSSEVHFTPQAILGLSDFSSLTTDEVLLEHVIELTLAVLGDTLILFLKISGLSDEEIELEAAKLNELFRKEE